MKLFDVGRHAEGFVAVGQEATGVIAVGQLATGVIAVGQLARGFVVVGQLALGVLAFGQLTVAVTWGGGMLGVAGVRSRASLLVWGVLGRGRLFADGRLQPAIEPVRLSGLPAGATFVRVAAMAAVVGLVVAVGLGWFPGWVAGAS